MRLRIVDDDLHLRKLVRTYAQLEQFQCEEAVNGSLKASGRPSF